MPSVSTTALPPILERTETLSLFQVSSLFIAERIALRTCCSWHMRREEHRLKQSANPLPWKKSNQKRRSCFQGAEGCRRVRRSETWNLRLASFTSLAPSCALHSSATGRFRRPFFALRKIAGYIKVCSLSPWAKPRCLVPFLNAPR